MSLIRNEKEPLPPLVRWSLCALLCALMLLAGPSARAADIPAVKVLGSNGAVTVAVETVGETHTPLYTTDGIHWKAGEAPADFPAYVQGDGARWAKALRGCWDGERFLLWNRTVGAPAYASADGIHWAEWSGPAPKACPRGAAELGPYRFELEGNELWLMDRTGRGLILPDVGARSGYLALGDIAAYYVPGGVAVEVCDQWDITGAKKLTFYYETSSLDWCMEHLAKSRTPKPGADWAGFTAGNGVILCQAPVGTMGSEVWTSTDAVHWAPVLDQGWSGERCGMELSPYNGKTFVMQDAGTGKLFHSEDGILWTAADSPIPELQGGGKEAGCVLAWTGDGYIACPQGGTGAPGDSGRRVTFLDAALKPTGASHGFEDAVIDVSYADGVCYAQTVDGNWEPKAVFSSTDKVSWTETELGALPRQMPAGARLADAWSSLADPYLLYLDSGGELWVSLDGVNYGSLGPFLEEGEPWGGFVKGYAGRDGMLVLGVESLTFDNISMSVFVQPVDAPYTGVARTYTRARLDAALANPAPVTQEVLGTAADGKTQVRQLKLRRERDGMVNWSAVLCQYSRDGGATWQDASFGGADTRMDLELLPYNGHSFMLANPLSSCWLVSEDGASWRNLPKDWRGESHGMGQFLWAGEFYLVRQTTYSGGMMGMPAEDSGKNSTVQRLDEGFQVTASHDFGAQVTAIGYENGLCYARADGIIYTSRDGETWTVTGLNAIPAGADIA